MPVKVPAAVTVFLLALTMLTALPVRAVAAAPGLCSSSSHPALAARISRGIEAARRGRESFVAVEVDDPGAGVLCRLDSGTHFDSASVVKVTILGTLLRGRAGGAPDADRAGAGAGVGDDHPFGQRGRVRAVG
jgi:hypothetical protein